jgi:hypothetical protein
MNADPLRIMARRSMLTGKGPISPAEVERMSVSTVGGSNASTLANLQRQLVSDQRVLQTDQRSHADQKVLTLDQARITLDSAAIAAASTQGAQTQTSGLTPSQTPRQGAPTTGAAATSGVTSSRSATKVDLYL